MPVLGIICVSPGETSALPQLPLCFSYLNPHTKVLTNSSTIPSESFCDGVPLSVKTQTMHILPLSVRCVIRLLGVRRVLLRGHVLLRAIFCDFCWRRLDFRFCTLLLRCIDPL